MPTSNVIVDSSAFVNPASTGAHVAEPSSLVCPSGHMSQEDAPEAEYRPAGQTDAATAPATQAYVPGSANVQLAVASRFAKRPGSQSAHAEAFAPE